MCSDNKFACLNWCCQLQHSYRASMVYFVLFTDDKLLKLHRCTFYASAGILWLLYILAIQCTRSQITRDGLSFWLARHGQQTTTAVKHQHQVAHWSCLVLTRRRVFHQWTRWSSPSKYGSSAATDDTGWVKQTCCHSIFHGIVVTSPIAKIFSQQPNSLQILWITTLPATFGENFV